MRTLLCAGVVAVGLAGCARIAVSFSRHPRTLHLRLGEEIGVDNSLGGVRRALVHESPGHWALDRTPPGDCSQTVVKFRAADSHVHDAQDRGVAASRSGGVDDYVRLVA